MDLIYNIPKYKEISPSFFGMVFFPFLFGLMFGDVFHGSILLIFALCLFYLKIQKLSEIKWLLCTMGFFSIYCGLIYNEFLGVSIPLFTSCKSLNKCNYPLGIDYIWSTSINENQFLNSFKMKTSIVIGVIHMSFGLIFSGLNDLHFGHFSDFFLEFLPKLIFFWSTFGYMVFCIFYKWSQDYSMDTS